MARKSSSPNPPASQIVKRHQLSERFADPDLVDGIFEYLVKLVPEIADKAAEVKAAVRDEFAGIETYVRKRHVSQSDLARQVLALFNGRNATEVARSLNISRATVYRVLKQPGGRKQSQVSEK